jgi:hypothetical protein
MQAAISGMGEWDGVAGVEGETPDLKNIFVYSYFLIHIFSS